MTNTLEMKFISDLNARQTINVPMADKDVTVETIKAAMNRIIATGIVLMKSGEPKYIDSAALVTTTIDKHKM